jgi:hypothetical protein
MIFTDEKNKSAKVIYDTLVGRIRAESDVLLEQAKKIGAMHDSPGKDKMEQQFSYRQKAMRELQHALDWLVDQIINDNR